MPFSYSTTYVLDKSHFSETFDESTSPKPPQQAYLKALILAGVGAALLFLTQVSPYLGWFLLALAGVEALSVRFQKSWWLARQMLSRAAGNPLTLTINEAGIHSKSAYVDSHLAWMDISKIEKTNQGWLLYHGGGRAYLSDRCLSDEAEQFIRDKANAADRKLDT